MVKARTQFDAHARVHANPGNPEKILFTPKFDSNGAMELIEAGKEDLYASIQSHKDSCDINLILKRFARGDVSALQKRQGMFGDFTDAPSSYAEALNSMIIAEQYFNSLPLETRAQFDHNFHRFLLSLDQPDFESKFSAGVKKPSVVAGKVREDIGEPTPSAAPINSTPDTPAT